MAKEAKELWEARGAYVFRGSDCIAICDTDNATPEIYASRARRMAASNELLAAAKRALNVLKGTGESVRPGNALGALDAAIRKAEPA